MKAFAPLALLAALMLVGCAPQPEAPSEPTQASADPNPIVTKVDSTPAEPLPDKPADGDEVVVLNTEKGQIVLMLYPQIAPNHVENFKSLVKEGFYDGTRFHRCIPGFMIQGGDPNSKDKALSGNWGMGGKMNDDGSERNVKLETSARIKHERGTLSMARSQDPNSASSQFFITVAERSDLDGQYSAFGRVVEGMEVVDQIVQTGSGDNNGAVDPSKAVMIKKATVETWPVKK